MLFGRAIDVRVVERDGKYRFERLVKLFGFIKYWEFIPDVCGFSPYEVSTHEEAVSEYARFRKQLTVEKEPWKVVYEDSKE